MSKKESLKLDEVSFDKGNEGQILPTIRNKELVAKLTSGYDSADKIPAPIRNIASAVFVTEFAWSGAVVDLYASPEDALKSHRAKELTAELNKQYINNR